MLMEITELHVTQRQSIGLPSHLDGDVITLYFSPTSCFFLIRSQIPMMYLIYPGVWTDCSNLTEDYMGGYSSLGNNVIMHGK